jgi:hypothetical protein
VLHPGTMKGNCRSQEVVIELLTFKLTLISIQPK